MAEGEQAQVSIEEANKRLPGATWFLRCGECQTMYIAKGGWNIFTGADAVAWYRPPAQRKPKKCAHPKERAQAWNGTRWEFVTEVHVDEGVDADG